MIESPSAEYAVFMTKVLSIFARINSHQELHWGIWKPGPISEGFIPLPAAEPIVFYVDCSDMFWWAHSDAEQLTPENIHILEQAILDVKEALETASDATAYSATELFVARVRGMRPQGAKYEYLDKKLWPLFDACGPVRESGTGNPKPHPETA